MTYIKYKDHKFQARAQQIIQISNDIITDYQDQGYTLTLRQLYYQFVARDFIENNEHSYNSLGATITRAREAGLISWEAIEDRSRSHESWLNQPSERQALKGVERKCQIDPWDSQDHYVEVWIEKEALKNVLERPCNRLRLPYMACKGYLSASEAWRAGQRFEEARDRGQNPVLIHLGDHDPSGIDMTRDNRDRLRMFSGWEDVEVVRIALNMDQVDQYNPPPNPAKVKDSRADDYIARFGRTSWELDALEPSVIEKLVTTTAESYIDWDRWEQSQEEEREKRAVLKKLYAYWPEVKDFIQSMDDEED